MKVKFFIYLSLCSAFISCTDESSHKSQGLDNARETSLDSAMETSIASENLSKERFPLPTNLDSSNYTSINTNSYLIERLRLDSIINVLEVDTTIPDNIRRQRLIYYKIEKGRLNERLYKHKQETICGFVNNTVNVEDFINKETITRDFVSRHMSPVGLIRWNRDFGNLFRQPLDNEGTVKGRHWGSGFLIDKDIFVTAGHCFDPMVNGHTTPIKGNTPLTSKELSKLMNVVFNFQTFKGTHTIRNDSISYPVLELLEYRNGNLDYAVVKLGKDKFGNKPGDIFGRLNVSPDKHFDRDSMLCIIQHPSGRVKCVDSGPLFFKTNEKIYYNNIDTEGGSSGSPVLLCCDGIAIGIHVKGGCEELMGYNEAIRIDAVKKFSKYIK